MDKKLIVDIDKIEYKSKKSEVENSFDDLKKNIELLPKVLKIFQKIHIERLKIDGNEFTISLNDEAIYLDNKFINLSSKIDFRAQQVLFDLYSLYLKDAKVMFNGKTKIDYFNEKLDHLGKVFYEDIEANINLNMTPHKADFYINSKPFESLKFLKRFFRLSTEAEEWMYDNVKGDIKLNELYGSVDLDKLEVIERSLNGKASINKAKIKFEKALDAIETKRVDINFKKGNLYFDLIEPMYKGKSLKGSKVYINNLVSEQKGEVVVEIKAKTKLDKDILEILNSYDVKLPLLQKSGITDAKVKLVIPYLINKKMTTKGEFIVQNADLLLNSFEFSTKKALVLLDDTIVNIKNADIKHKEMIKANLDLRIDTSTYKASGKALINSFLIKAKDDELVHINGKETSVEVDFLKDVSIALDTLKTKIDIKDRVEVSLKDLSLIYEYSNLLKDLSVKNGKLTLSIKDENDITFDTFVSGLEFPIYKDKNLVESLYLNGIVTDKLVQVKSYDNNIEYKIENEEQFLFLKNLTVFIDTKAKSDKQLPVLNIEAKDSKLKIDEDIYNIINAKVKLDPKETTFFASLKDLDIPLKKFNKNIKELELIGSIKGDKISLYNKNRSIKLDIEDHKLKLYLTGYDLYFDTRKDEDSSITSVDVKAIDSDIILNEKFRFLADSYEIRVRKDSKYLNLKHGKSELTYKELNNGKINLYGNNISDKFVNTIFDKEILKDGNIMLVAKGVKEKLTGKLLLTNSKIEDLAILNNLLLFIHTSPALINPLLAIPSLVGTASNDGFNLSGYRVVDGIMEFDYNHNSKMLDITKLVSIGNGIDFDGFGKVNLNSGQLDSKIKMIFFKNYSSIVGAIPVVNYVVLGSDKRVETQVNVFGPLNNPKISTNLTKEAFSVPVNIAKRVLTSPAKFIEFLNDLAGSNSEEKNKE